MKSPLVPISILSIYTNRLKDRLPLPERMAKCTPDTYTAIMQVAEALASRNGKLVLSDLFRSYDMQAQSHQDYVSGKKKAFSPPPGGSFHEAGRAFDLDLDSIGISLAEFWELSAPYGLRPIIKTPNPSAKEAWHFDCRGSHQIVYDYYATGKGKNFNAYTAGAASAILSVGVQVEYFGKNQVAAAIQSGLIRLGKVIGNIDGQPGKRTQKALEELNIAFTPENYAGILVQVENLVQEQFPTEFVLPKA